MQNAVGRDDLRQRTTRFALQIIQCYGSLPSRAEATILGKQLLRSGTSVGANYREAHRSRSNSEFMAKLGICLQELEETDYWLELLLLANLQTSTIINPLRDETSQLIAIFTTIVKKKRLQLKEPVTTYDFNDYEDS